MLKFVSFFMDKLIVHREISFLVGKREKGPGMNLERII